MTTKKTRIFLICVVLIISLACSFTSKNSNEESEGIDNSEEQGIGPGNPNDTGGNSEEQESNAEGIQYFSALPVDFSDPSGNLRGLKMRALQSMSHWDIVIIVENIATDPLQIICDLELKVQVFDEAGKLIGEDNWSILDRAVPIGHQTVLMVYPPKWEGYAERFSVEVTSVKARFIQDDMQEVFRNTNMPYPIFNIAADPFTITEENLFEDKVISAMANAVISNSHPGQAQQVVSNAVYFDANGQIVGFAYGETVSIEAASQAATVFYGNSYFAGYPVSVDYFATTSPYYLEEIFKMW